MGSQRGAELGTGSPTHAQRGQGAWRRSPRQARPTRGGLHQNPQRGGSERAPGLQDTPAHQEGGTPPSTGRHLLCSYPSGLALQTSVPGCSPDSFIMFCTTSWKTEALPRVLGATVGNSQAPGGSVGSPSVQPASRSEAHATNALVTGAGSGGGRPSEVGSTLTSRCQSWTEPQGPRLVCRPRWRGGTTAQQVSGALWV